MTTKKAAPAPQAAPAKTNGISLQKKELSLILSILAPFIPSRVGLISARVANGMLEFFATVGFYDGSALVRVPCRNEPFGWKHVNGPAFSGVISSASDGDISLEFGENALTVKYPKTTNDLKYFEPQKWMEMKFPAPGASLSGDDFNAIAMMTEAASDDETRPNLNGVYFAVTKGELETAASDGFILSFKSVRSNIEDVRGAIYSARALFNAKRAIKAGDAETLGFGFASKGTDVIPGIVLSAQRDHGIEAMIHIPRMEGNFPDYKQITSAAPDARKCVRVELPTPTMETMLKRAKALEGNLFFQVLGGRFWFMSVNEVTGQKSIDSVPVDGVQKDSVVMCYASSKFRDALKACAANGKVSLTFPEANNKPMLLEGKASGIAMPLVNPLKESPFKNLQPTLI